jgi:hypothetical protein
MYYIYIYIYIYVRVYIYMRVYIYILHVVFKLPSVPTLTTPIQILSIDSSHKP